MTGHPPDTLIRPLAESRPPGQTWRQVEPVGPAPDQPTLDLGPTTDGVPEQPRPSGVRVSVVRSRWCARPGARLPDARSWSVSLAQAMVEALHALRPVDQLNRWVAEDVLAAIFLHQRRRRSEPERVTAPPVLRSVRLQHPHPEAAEVAVHVSVAGQSAAMAFRLQASGDRWLCTALELGPRTG